MNVSHRLSVRASVCAASLAVAGLNPAWADNPDLRSQPEQFVVPATTKAATATPRIDRRGASVAAQSIRLASPLPAEIESLRRNNATRHGTRGLQVGITRDVSATRNASLAQGLVWETRSDGSRRTRIDVTSPGASALRVALSFGRLPSDIAISFHGQGDDAETFGPVRAATLLEHDSYWSPVIDGETATVVIDLPAGQAVDALALTIPRVSHLVFDPRRNEWQKDTGIGASAGCEPDVVCSQPDASLRATASSVARMIYTEPDGSYLCTGTLLADKDPGSQIPYFLTANHCISDNATAATLNTYWFFEAYACGSNLAPYQQQLAGGAVLLVTDEALDNTLLRLKETPPSGATLSAFDANPIAQTIAAVGIHHPKGDLKKLNRGAVVGYGSFNGQGSFVDVRWDVGVTEGGSSGSGIFTNSNGIYYIRGALKGGSSYCEFPGGHDLYSRLDYAWPQLQGYLGADVSSTVVVEFYHSGFGHYFMTGFPEEVAALDAGNPAGWTRTGQTFIASSAASGALSSVCRFFSTSFAPKSSHFYTGNANECTTLKSNPNWQFEAISFHTATPSASGTCASGTVPLYRLYNNGQGGAPNHRYTTSLSIRDQMMQRGWIPEGYGSLGVVACVR